MGEVNGDPPLGRRNDLPDAVLVAENKKDDNDADDDGYNDDMMRLMKITMILH